MSFTSPKLVQKPGIVILIDVVLVPQAGIADAGLAAVALSPDASLRKADRAAAFRDCSGARCVALDYPRRLFRSGVIIDGEPQEGIAPMMG